jgi:hypothetical protein
MLQVADYWELALWAAASTIAVISLLRLMARQRALLVAQLKDQVAQRRRRAEKSSRRQPPDVAQPSEHRRKRAA